MAYEFKLPDLGEGLTEGEIARWLVVEGQEIAEDDPLVEIQTDKTTVEIPSPAAGVVSQILVAEGMVVPVGTLLVVIGGDGIAPVVQNEQASPASGSEPQSPTRPVRATPLVKKIAKELGRRARLRVRDRSRKGGSPRTTSAAPRCLWLRATKSEVSRKDDESGCAGCGGSWRSTWRARIAR